MKEEAKSADVKITEETVDVNQNICGDPGIVLKLFICVLDIFLLTVLFLDGPIKCEGYLRTWIVGALILSAFYYTFIERIQRMLKDDKGFFFEVFLMLLCFLWVYYGTIQINKSTTCQKTAPFVFWTVFSLVTTLWCAIFGMILSLMIITIGSFFIARTKVNEK